MQELHNSLYFCQSENPSNFDLAETIPGRSADFYSELARKHKVVLVTSLFEKRTEGLYHNTAVVFEADGTIAGKYRKMHIPDDPAYYEKFEPLTAEDVTGISKEILRLLTEQKYADIEWGLTCLTGK